MKDLFQKFLLQYNGKIDVGNTPENIGQCTGLINVWVQELNLPHLWGDGKDIFALADERFYTKILNTPEAIPQTGDIICWGAGYNGNYGHTAIATGTANLNTLECFSQNDPLKSNSHLKTYKYTHIIGWLRPIIKDLQAELDKVRLERDKNWDLYLPFKDAGFPTINDVIKTIEEKQAMIRAVDGFRVAITKSLGIEGADWQRILDEVNKTIKEKDDIFDQAKVADTLWDAIVGQTGLQVVKYTPEGVKSLVDSLDTLKHSVPEGYRILTEKEYSQLTAKKTLDRFTKMELFQEIIKRFFK